MHIKFRKTAKLVAATMLCLPFCVSASILERLGGTWDTMPIDQPICVSDEYHHTIVVSADKQRVTFKHVKPIESPNGKIDTYSYKVLYSSEDRVTMIKENETRTTPNGDRIIWELILEKSDYYRWRIYGAPPDWRNTVVGKLCNK